MNFELDPLQKIVYKKLGELKAQIEATEESKGWKSFLHRICNQPSERTKGLYIWGGVGRGKTALMDSFYDAVDIESKRRIHFHALMKGIHDEIAMVGELSDPLRKIVARIARKYRLLCLDEFFVSDIGDAMILSRVLDELFDRNVILVTTSNIRPSELYENGLQRRLFLPAIDLIRKHTEVIHLQGVTDYRLQTLRRESLYRIGTEATPELVKQDISKFLADCVVEDSPLVVNHRKIDVVFSGSGYIGLTFHSLCVESRSSADYIEIAKMHHTVFIYGIKQISKYQESACKRFISLIDVLYDHRVNLVLQAETELSYWYRGFMHTDEYQRTESRIVEMLSEDYISKAHHA